ncbi:type II toxin-antitoxin system ParD family antitoxin [Paraburkholderia sp. RL18-103-BIB-C]|uniref:type II toxin-antitoxin system ParD family antitoxin n=1 Tax=unclassified Paraburkholderia TaxID=2615204 RepID=UPI0038B90252
MNINFAPVDEQFIKQNVENGVYSNANELVRDAVRRLREADERRAELFAALQMGEDDIAAGRTRTYTRGFVQSLHERVLSRAAAGEKPKSDVAP